jgi:signal transduction histidine kinase/DNA-binding response OmpR family regulator
METGMIDPLIQHTHQYDILIVDDDPDSLELLGRFLNGHGYRVRPAPNGRHALKSIEAKRPDLVLLDVKMPGMDGYEVCRRIKAGKQSRNVPVIFISVYGETVKKVHGFKAGAVDFITKPFEENEVLMRVQTHLRLHELTEHLEHKVAEQTAKLSLANQQLQRQITEYRRVEQKLSWEAKINLATAELSQNLLSPASLDHIAFLVLEQAKRFTNSPFGFVGHIDPKTGYLVSPTLTRDIWDSCEVPEKDIIFKEFKGLWGWVLENRKPLLTNSPVDDPRSSGTPPGHVPIGRFMSAPALIDEKLVGQISVANADNDYNHHELKVVERLATLYAIAIQRRQAEDELAGHRGQLEELVMERTKELQGFTYTVSHDLRAPLRHLDGYIELLQKKIGSVLDQQGQHYMDVISGAARKMDMLIDDLLQYSRMGRHDLSLRKVDLELLVRDVIQDNEPDEAGRNIAWHVSKLPAVKGDATVLRMVLDNLISNALKFTRLRQQANIEIGSKPGRDSETVIYVRDNGVGFDMAHADKLFNVFQRLHRAEEFDGTGIGLANVRRIISKHGGRTWAKGKVGQGATFYFSLPQTSQIA